MKRRDSLVRNGIVVLLFAVCLFGVWTEFSSEASANGVQSGSHKVRQQKRRASETEHRQQAKGSRTPFEREVESMFGVAIQTRQGEMTVRHQRDLQGRIRKQILVGRDFSEIQLDQDADGTVDFWEVKRGRRTITASQPLRGRFLKIEISDKEKGGRRDSVYLLDLRERRYNLHATNFTPNSKKMYSSADGFEALGDAKFDQILLMETSFADKSAPSAPTLNNEYDPLVDNPDWIAYQSDILGFNFMCEDPNSFSGRLANLQRQWWVLLQHDLEEKTDLLKEKIKASTMFDKTCKTAARAKDFDAMAEGLAKLMMSSSKGERFETEVTRGRWLRCLEKSGLPVSAARMEVAFLANLNNPLQSQAMIKCEWTPGSAGLSYPGYADAQGQIHMRMCL
ncbi:MAG: hypothetical protein RBT63_07730, partial [Bdellovibrionales bacterium]|nr:hypothetical protein [Bdellovibrionales bacterium]